MRFLCAEVSKQAVAFFILLARFKLFSACRQRFKLLVQLRKLVHHGGIHSKAGCRFVHKVYSLIGQVTVCNITLGKHYHTADKSFGNLNAVIILVVLLYTLEDLDCIFNIGLVNHNGLESALKGRVLFYILSVFRKCGCANHLYFPAGKSRFKDVCGVHTTLCRTGRNHGVYLVKHQNDVAQLLNFVNKPLDAVFKLTSELGARNNSGHIHKVNFLVL